MGFEHLALNKEPVSLLKNIFIQRTLGRMDTVSNIGGIPKDVSIHTAAAHIVYTDQILIATWVLLPAN